MSDDINQRLFIRRIKPYKNKVIQILQEEITMDENAKTNEFKEMVKASLGELSNEEIEKLKKFKETSGDISEHHGNCEELSDEQLECVGGGNGTGDDYAKSSRDMILNAKQSEKQTDNLIQSQNNSSLLTEDIIQPATRRDTRINEIMSETETQQAGEAILKKVSPFGL